MSSLPPWSELAQLHVVRNVAKLLGRRWRLGIGFVSNADITAPTDNAYFDGATLCQTIQGRAEGLAACQNSSAGCWRELGDDPLAVITRSCHAGLIELAAPVMCGEEPIGVLLAGGFVRSESRDPWPEINRRVAGLSIPARDRDRAAARQPVLEESEESFISELLRGAADDIGGYLEDKRRLLGELDRERTRFGSLVGSSPAMQQLYSTLDRIVRADTTVLIQGENGTGKELVARAIHQHSKRASRPFVVQNCSAFNDNLLDSELFGHKRGAFTGAVGDKRGLFEVADTGTFFLDEIGDMSPALQVKVLRVLQEGTFTPVGDTVEHKVDVRIIAATNRDLKAMVAAGKFREDLYYRINVINLVLPPLRERRPDISLLAEVFLQRHAGTGRPKTLSPGAVERLEGHAWPGNVRELENEIERAVVLSAGRDTIEELDLSERLQSAAPAPLTLDQIESLSLPEAIKTLERRMIVAALERNGWNKTRAATELQVSRRNLIRLVQKYELEK